MDQGYFSRFHISCAFLQAPVPGSTPLLAPEGNGSKETHNTSLYWQMRASQAVQVVNNLSANAGDAGSIPGSGRSLGRGNDNSLHILPGKSMDREDRGATVHGLAELDMIEHTHRHWQMSACPWKHMSGAAPHREGGRVTFQPC